MPTTIESVTCRHCGQPLTWGKNERWKGITYTCFDRPGRVYSVHQPRKTVDTTA